MSLNLSAGARVGVDSLVSLTRTEGQADLESKLKGGLNVWTIKRTKKIM